MPRHTTAPISRRVGLSKGDKVDSLHKALSQKKGLLKVPEDIHDPPVSSGSEGEWSEVDEAAHDSQAVSSVPSAQKVLPNASKSPSETSVRDSSDELDDANARRANIKSTNFSAPRNDDPFSRTKSQKKYGGFDYNPIKAPRNTYSRAGKKSKASQASRKSPTPRDEDDTDSSQKPRGLVVPPDDISSSPQKTRKRLKVVESVDAYDFLNTPEKPVKFVRRGSPEIDSPSSALKRKREMKRARKLKKEESPSPEVVRFKMPEDLPEVGTNPIDLNSLEVPFVSSDEDDAVPSTPPSEDNEEPKPTQCPWCEEHVDEAHLKDFAKGKRLTVAMQQRFCRAHRKRTAKTKWRTRGYPDIDWDGLEDRLGDHDAALLRIIKGKPSHYRDLLAERIRSGKVRSMKKEDDMNPGYYGPRGFALMGEYLVTKYGGLLKRNAIEDRVISGRGPTAFIQFVLIAELAVLLIMEDMDVSNDEAREIMIESKALGELMNEEL